jgi:hypothetical protein
MEIALPTNSVTNLLTAIYALRATTTVPQEPPAEIDRGSLKGSEIPVLLYIGP